MSKAGEKLIEAAQSGIGRIHFFNPFTGKMEEFISDRDATAKMLFAAAERIAEVQCEIDQIRSYLVMD